MEPESVLISAFLTSTFTSTCASDSPITSSTYFSFPSTASNVASISFLYFPASNSPSFGASKVSSLLSSNGLTSISVPSSFAKRIFKSSAIFSSSFIATCVVIDLLSSDTSDFAVAVGFILNTTTFSILAK